MKILSEQVPGQSAAAHGAASMARKAIGLLSGGLDSNLAVRMMVAQGIEVVALNFMSPFCTCTSKSSGCKSQAASIAKELGIRIRMVYKGEQFLEIIRNPKFGYGKHLNPCVDCRILMFRAAKEVMEEEGASFMFTGEVLGQRPMSQMRKRIELIERETGMAGLILRPLSAHLFEPTFAEKAGIVDREKLLSIEGRSRKKQLDLAREYEVTGNLCTGGGCLLTDGNFAPRVKDMLDHTEHASSRAARLLRFGRHFRISETCKAVVGRNDDENRNIERLAEKGQVFYRVRDYAGPLAMVDGSEGNSGNFIAGIAVWYSGAPKDGPVEVERSVKGDDGVSVVSVSAVRPEEFESLRI